MHDDVNRNARHHIGEATLAPEGGHELAVLQLREGVERDAAPDVDTAGRQHLQGEIAELGGQDLDAVLAYLGTLR